MVPRAGLEPARIAPHAPQTCAATNYATSAIRSWNVTKSYLLAGASVFAAGASVFGASVFAGAELALASGAAMLEFASGTLAGASAGVSSVVLCKTETFPLNTGSEIIRAVSINTVAATIVTFDKTEAVPRGPNAALDTLLVNRAPASVLPGWSSTDPTRTMQDMKNNAYNTYNKFLTHL